MQPEVIDKRHHYKTARVKVDLFTHQQTPILRAGDFVCLNEFNEQTGNFKVCHKGTVVTVNEEHLYNFVL